MNDTMNLKFGDTVEITLGSAKTRNLRKLRGTFVGLHSRSIGDTHAVMEARVVTAEGEVTGHRVVKVEEAAGGRKGFEMVQYTKMVKNSPRSIARVIRAAK